MDRNPEVMASLKGYKGSIFWLLLLLISLSKCETESPSEGTKIDYTGQKGTVTDLENKVYQTIGIGTQIWMAENLATIKLNNGTLLSQITDDSIWSEPWNKQPAYCSYNNDSINYKKTYGLLYNYYAVKTGLLCPDGWHVPSRADWDTLIQFAGGSNIAGGKLKESSLWVDSHSFEEKFGFVALPGGRRMFYTGRFSDIGTGAYWWTADSINFLQAYGVAIINSDTHIGAGELAKRYGFNIRCIKNK